MLLVDYDSMDADPSLGRPYFIFYDQVGLPSHIHDARGNIVWLARTTDPYGLLDLDPKSHIAFHLRFPGHYFDHETGLHYNRFRYYSPRLGRYLQSDPMGQAGGVNVYAYPANPLLCVDVFGLMCKKGGEGAERPGDAGPQQKAPAVVQGGGLTPKEINKTNRILARIHEKAQEGKFRRGSDYHGDTRHQSPTPKLSIFFEIQTVSICPLGKMDASRTSKTET